MTAPADVRPNPYVGPRSFERGETLYGRARELRELTRLLVAERIVLCHSPSGAGKTSLIQASLIPELEEQRDFYVFPLIRVHLELEESSRLPSGTNRYLLSTLRCLESARPVEEQLEFAELARMSLAEYMAQCTNPPDAERDGVLIFDQFEEIVTIEPVKLADKADFFAQVGELLRNNEGLWALFAMREEFVASLDPYLDSIPRRLRTTYRLPLLDQEMAIEAMRQPALAAGVDFTESAAAKLAADLARVRVQRPDGSTDYQAGAYIEPVQLQVVCYRLWEQLSPGTTSITDADVGAQGDVNDALAGFYNAQVAAIAARTDCPEQVIRAWFDQKIITPEGVRSQVLQGPELSGDLPNRIVDELVRTHLVRVERQRGSVWLELAHDRLIEPIRMANAAWWEANLSTLQRQAALWERERRPEGLLLQGEALDAAEIWAAEHVAELNFTEQDFLAACRLAQNNAEHERRNRRRISQLTRIALILSEILLVAALFVVQQYLQANVAREEAEQAALNEAAARSTAEISLAANQSLLGTAEAAKATAEAERLNAESSRATAQVDARNARDALATAEAAQGQADLSANQQAALKLATDLFTALDNGDLDQALTLALASLHAPVEVPQTDLLLSRAADLSGTRLSLPVNDTAILAMQATSDGRSIYSGDRRGFVRIWDSTTGQKLDEFQAHSDGVQDIAFSPDGQLFATSSGNFAISLWKTVDRSLVSTIVKHRSPVLGIVFTPDGQTLISAGNDNKIYLWEIATRRELGSFDGLPAIALSSNGSLLATSSTSNTIILRDLTTSVEPRRLAGHSKPIQALLFTPDDKSIISGSLDSTIRLWDAATSQELRRFNGHTAGIWSLSLSADASRLLSSSADNTIRLWNTDTGEELRRYPGHVGSVYSVSFLAGDRHFVSGAEDGQARIWDVAGRQELAVLDQATGPIYSTAISPDGSRVLAGSGDGAIYEWQVVRRDEFELQTRQLTLPIITTAEIQAVAYSPDELHPLSAEKHRLG